MNVSKLFPIFIIFSISLGSISSSACKDIIAIGDAAAGDFNILMKIRDPSRPGPQVLCIINPGYSYKYHLPWTGKKVKFFVERKFIGVVTKGDVPPNIVKPGIALSDAGIAYGDADSPSYWINPLRTAWDDFDWIRYACESAESEKKAVYLLREVVEKLHAPSVSENLFVVGPNKGYVMEGDVLRFDVKEVEDLLVMSNYPKSLWKNRMLKRFLISKDFDFERTSTVRKGSVVRLQGLLGIKILDIRNGGAFVKGYPFGKKTYIKEGKGKVVGPFWIEILKVSRNEVKIRMCYKYKEWENKLMEILEGRYGKIDVKDMMEISRLHAEDLYGLRGMCEGYYKCAAICKIPYKFYDILSCMWFAPDQCSSIFIPVHICCNDIYQPYKNGEAAEIAKNILLEFGHGGFSDYASKVEDVFIKEVKLAEDIAKRLIVCGKDPSNFITTIDLNLQKQAYFTQEFVLMLKNKNKRIPMIWGEDYNSTISKFILLSDSLEEEELKILGKIAESIARVKFEEFKILGEIDANRNLSFLKCINLLNIGKFKEGFIELEEFLSCEKTNSFIKTDSLPSINLYYIWIAMIFVIVLLVGLIFNRRK